VTQAFRADSLFGSLTTGHTASSASDLFLYHNPYTGAKKTAHVEAAMQLRGVPFLLQCTSVKKDSLGGNLAGI
jgi:hypothetical protein